MTQQNSIQSKESKKSIEESSNIYLLKEILFFLFCAFLVINVAALTVATSSRLYSYVAG